MAKMPTEGDVRPFYMHGNDFYSLQGKLGRVVFGQETIIPNSERIFKNAGCGIIAFSAEEDL